MSRGRFEIALELLCQSLRDDPVCRSIPGAGISIRNVDTNLAVTVQGAADGSYFISQLPVGKYQLIVEAKGFKKYTRDGIALGLGDKAIADVRMEIGAATDSVTVSAELTGMLLEVGADANVANEDGQTPLMLAARTGDVAVAKGKKSVG